MSLALLMQNNMIGTRMINLRNQILGQIERKVTLRANGKEIELTYQFLLTRE